MVILVLAGALGCSATDSDEPAGAEGPSRTSQGGRAPSATGEPGPTNERSLIRDYRESGTEADVRFGMSAPVDLWDARLDDVGPVGARRIYGDLSSPDRALALAEGELAVGRMPVVSFKIPDTDWRGVADGSYDTLLTSVADRLGAPGGRVFVTLHHEPAGDGTPADYAAMMAHALPLLGKAPNVDAGPIVNGFWWSAVGGGLTDAEIGRWLPPNVLSRSEIVAADTYETVSAGRSTEGADAKIAAFSSWARRSGVDRLGIGEYNGLGAQSIRSAGLAVLSDPRIEFAVIFNSDRNTLASAPLTLTGERLRAFQDTLALARRLGADR